MGVSKRALNLNHIIMKTAIALLFIAVAVTAKPDPYYFYGLPLCPPALCTECAVEGATDVKAILAIDCAAVAVDCKEVVADCHEPLKGCRMCCHQRQIFGYRQSLFILPLPLIRNK